MIFTLIDDKRECLAVYSNGTFTFNEIPNNLSSTWDYSPILDDKCKDFVSLYCGGKSLTDMCPPELKNDWSKIKTKLKAYQTSFRESKVDTDNCIFDLIPLHVLAKYAEIENKIIKHVLETHEKPDNYTFLLSVQKLLKKIEKQPLNLAKSDYPTRIVYKLFGTKTGRLSTKSNSFPVLTIDKIKRNVLLPTNDLFISLDYNNFEPRVMLHLLGHKQPKQDLYEWMSQKVFKGLTRDETKKRFFKWFYNSNAEDPTLEKVFDRERITNKYWDGTEITTPFGRRIKADRYHALNYLIQSTATDLFLNQVLKLEKALDGRKTLISSLIHDNIVLDVDKEDKSMISELIQVFSNTEFGEFKTSVEAGKNFGDMKKL